MALECGKTKLRLLKIELPNRYVQENFKRIQLYIDNVICRDLGNGGSGGTGPQGPIGPPGPAGQDGNTILNDSGAPLSTLGVDGDFYIDTDVHEIYGPKTAGSWGLPTSLIGSGSGSQMCVSVVADETISATRAVYSIGSNRVRLSQPDDLDKTRVYGIAKTAATINNALDIIIDGVLEDVSFSGFTLNKTVYLSNNGVLTQVVPTVASEWSVPIGTYLGDNKVKIDIEEPILLI